MFLNHYIKSLVLLATIVSAFSSQPDTNQAEKADFDLQLHRLTNAIYPYRDRVKSTWTRRAATAQEDSEGPLTCQLCNSVMPLLHVWSKMYTKQEIQEIVIEACKNLGLAPKPDICDPIIKAYTDQFLYILKNTANPDDPNYAAQLCGILTPDCDHPAISNITINIAGDKPEASNRDILDATAPETTKIIQFTDLHVDLDFKANRTTDCGKGMPICCRDWQYGGIAVNGTGAGPFGDFRCGLPLSTAQHMMNHAKEQYPDARYIFLTGDYIHSAVWLYNQAENTRHHKAVTEALAETFPDKSVKIFPLVGNHEPHVVNMYPPEALWETEPGFNLGWLYETIMAPFKLRDPEMLSEEEFENFAKTGSYSVSPEDGLRLIVLNTNLCSPENFWLGFFPYSYAADQLQWLADELAKAEEAEENVLIVGHIEPGSCYKAWSNKFNEIVDRFEGIIRGSFFGHSHKPQYRTSLSRDETLKELKPVFSSVIAGSALPDLMHPTYSVFHADGERGADSKWDIVRHEITILHLGESNKANEPVFKKLADSYETFGMENLGPESVLDFGRRLICNQTLLDSYLTFHTKGNDTLDYRPCNMNNATCMTNILCNFVSSNAADNRGCQDIQKRFRTTRCDSGADYVISSFCMIAMSVLLTLKYGIF